ncbi:MAG: hypothetical protein FWH11_13405 [Micrococcales bacterium]|nr:hypothetical protein [Micrococcales bacterium]
MRRTTTRKFSILAVVLVLALAGCTGGKSATAPADPWVVVATDGTYDYTGDLTVAYDEALIVEYDPDVSVSGSTVYYDPGMTSWAGDIVAEPTGDSRRQGLTMSATAFHDGQPGQNACRPDDADALYWWHEDVANPCDQSIQQYLTEGSAWGVASQYWLVRTVGKDGEPLGRPLVTRVVVDYGDDALGVPESTISADADGDVTVTWTPSDGATSYRVLMWASEEPSDTSAPGPRHEGGKVLTEVSGTEWKVPSGEAYDGSYLQNAPLRMAALENKDFRSNIYGGDFDDPAYTYHLCVVATDGSRYSACQEHNLMGEVASLPYSGAVSTQLAQYADYRGSTGILTLVPTAYYYVALDGNLRMLQGHIDPDTFVYNGDGTWRVAVSGVGTNTWVYLDDRGVDQSDIKVFNANAQAAQVQALTGSVGPNGSLAAEPITGGSKTAPDTSYPVYGSTDLVQYLARQMIAHTVRIDASDYTDLPGEPELSDAVDEAITQNPYVLCVKNYYYYEDRVEVVYCYSKTEQETIQSAVAKQVDDILASIVDSSMSDREKVTAINDWIVANADYDYAAAAALADSYGIIPDGYEHAWSPSGVLLEGTGVCGGYAIAFSLLANAAGVETVVVTGPIIEMQLRHAWNKSYVNGQWKATDVTWNDGLFTNSFLLINDSQFVGSDARYEDSIWMNDARLTNYATP